MIAAIDIGGTSIKYGMLLETEEKPRFLIKGETASNAKLLGGPGIRRRVIGLIEQMIKEAPQEEEKGSGEVVPPEALSLKGIAISTAGMVDAREGRILYANENIPNYIGQSWKADMEEYFQVPCSAENDVNAAALGELAYGAGLGCDSMLMLTVGTGIGGAVILDRKIYRGFSQSAGEVGYMLVDGEPFQDIASTTALVRMAERLTGEKGLNGRVIFARAMEGDPHCRQAIEKQCEILAKGISNAVCVLNPERVVLGGGIMEQSAYLRPILEKYLEKYMNEAMFRSLQLAFARLGNDAGMAGAYYYFTCCQKGEEYE